MPQMKPLNWLNLLIFFYLILNLIMIFLNFMNNKMIKHSINMKKKFLFQINKML